MHEQTRAPDRARRLRVYSEEASSCTAWYGRKLLPLYHAGLLGRISRKETLQCADMRALRDLLGR